MSLAESGNSTCEVSLSALGTTPVTGRSGVSYMDLAQQAVIGRWPALLGASPAQGTAFNRAYCEDIGATDIPEATGVRHDSRRLKRLLESAARNISGEATLQSLAADVSGDGRSMDPNMRIPLPSGVHVIPLDAMTF